MKKTLKCFKCKKPIKKEYAYNGHYYHEDCLVNSVIKNYNKLTK